MKIFLLNSLILLAPLSAQSPFSRENDPIPPQVETMYEKGLLYLSKNQQKEGYWNDQTGSEPGVVGLCILAFLSHGEDPNHGPFADNISKAIGYLLKEQKKSNGYIGNSMYNHGFATLALAECYGAVNDPRIAPALSQAVELILSSQKRNRFYAWRYTPDSVDADTTVSGCQLVALLAARNAGIAVPDSAIEKGLSYMALCRNKQGGYGYTSSAGEKPTLTAIGVTCLALAKEKDDKGFKVSLNYLRENINYRERHYPFYFEYYMSQALFHGDEKLWQEWNTQNIRFLSASQNRDGFWDGGKGQAFSTAGALLSMALNYRFLPIYEK